MSVGAFDAFTHHAADAMSRRGSLRTLGSAAVLASLMAPVLSAEAKKGGKGKKNRNKCKQQVNRCKQGLPAACAAAFSDPEDASLCVVIFNDCCEPLRSCNAGQGLACVAERIAQIN